MSTRGFNRAGRLYYRDSALAGSIWPAIPEVFLYDDFIGTDTTDIVARVAGYKGLDPGDADAVTISAAADVPGVAKVLSGTTDNNHAFLYTPVNWYGKYSACFEARVAIDSAAAVGFAMGFIDAAGIALAGAFTLADATYNAQASNDGAVFLYDTDATTDTLRCHAVKATVKHASPVDTTLVPVAGTYYIYRVELEDNGTTVTAKFYRDGVLLATLADCLTRTVALTPFVSMGCRTGAAAKYALVDYGKAWQRRT